MPRNSSGIYNLPETPFVPGTVIESAPVNNDLSDIADALTQSLATTGVSSMSGPLKAANGTVSAPSITFANSLGTGFYRISADKIGYAVAGVNKATFNDDGTFDFTAIKFANANVAGNYLDWYEESTFIPSITFGGASVGVTYGTRTGKFTRIGNVVTFTITIILTSNGTSTGSVAITGLPYAVESDTSFSMIPFEGIIGLFPGDINISAGALAGTTSILLGVYSGVDENFNGLTEVNISDTAALTISGTYLV